jgi:hypothetical protein
VKKSEKQAKEALRKHPHALESDHVSVVTRKGGGLQYNQGQSVKQGFGSGLKDILAARAAAKKKK